jgi:hypothetical protein
MKKTLVSKKVSLGRAMSGPYVGQEVGLQLEIRETTNKLHRTTDLQNITDYLELSICGHVWDLSRYDYDTCGQCIDTIRECFPKNKRVQRICDIWEKWHLNDLNAGTDRQTEAIEGWKARGNKYEYTAVCDYLKEINLYADRGYRYGNEWLVRPLPQSVIDEILVLLKIDEKILAI